MANWHTPGCWVLFAKQLSSTSRVLQDCIVPVLSHAKRLRDRWFNQSLDLARYVGRHLRLSVDYRVGRRIRHTDPQVLPAKLRRKNVRHIAILDDVVTASATVNELARAFKKQAYKARMYERLPASAKYKNSH